MSEIFLLWKYRVSIHGSVVNLLVSLGYTSSPGCCHGFSLRWLEACLLDEEPLFDARIQQIVSGGEALVHSINAVKEKKGQNLTAQDKELLDILAFYDSLELYQSPRAHSLLFNAPVLQDGIEFISQVASSDAILSRGGLTQIYSEPVIYTKKEIKAYFDGLGVMIEKVCAKSQSTAPLGIVLSSHDHTIALTYTPGKGWTFMDINQYPSQFFMINKTDLLAERIMTGFIDSNSPYSAFNVSVFTTGNCVGLLTLIETFDSFKKSHPLTKEMANREADGIGLARIAAQCNHAPVIAELAKHGVDLNQANSNGASPAIIAAQNGHASVITELAKHGVDLNKADNDGATPAFIAAQEGQALVITELAKHGVDLNKARHDGTTPAYIAAQEGHVSVIAELAKHGVDLNKANSNGITLALIAARKGHVCVITELAKHGVDLNQADNDGVTPAFIAAQEGHVSVIAELAKHGVDLNQAKSNGVTPAYIAAQNGHVSVIAELAKYKVDLNQAMSNGITPAFIAAQKGHVCVIAELIKAGVNLNTPYTASVDSLRIYALSCGDQVMERMDDYINQQLVLSPTSQRMSMTPYDIAVVMGHHEMVRLLSKREVQDPKERLNVILMEQSGHDKTIGDGFTFFSSSVKEDEVSNGVNQKEYSDDYQDSSKKRTCYIL